MSTIRKRGDKWQSIIRISGHPLIAKSFISKTEALIRSALKKNYSWQIFTLSMILTKVIISKFAINGPENVHLLIIFYYQFNTIDNLKNMIFFKKIWDFLKVRKKIWLYPSLFLIALFAFVIILSHGSEITPFIYRIFE